MELRFVAPDLRKFDLFVSEVLAVSLFEGDRPPQGTAGLVDYRMAGQISALIEKGTLAGRLGEQMLLAARPRLPFDKLLIVGGGKAEDFNPQIFAGIIDQLLGTLAELHVRRAVVELPGRATDLIEPELASDILLERAGNDPKFDTWTLVESGEAQRRINSRFRRDRRSRWGLGR